MIDIEKINTILTSIRIMKEQKQAIKELNVILEEKDERIKSLELSLKLIRIDLDLMHDIESLRDGSHQVINKCSNLVQFIDNTLNK